MRSKVRAQYLQTMINMDIIKISIQDDAYPSHLKNIKNPPLNLYCIGNIKLLKTPGVAVVGTRRCSSYGKWAAYEIGKRIASCGVTVISGMADGIDTRSHLGCLDVNGNTIAVLGTCITTCYPKTNRALYEKIAKHGLLVSEYGFEDKTGKWSFPQRNRIISGLSKSVVIVEGGLKSGSMITANFALEQSRDVYAVPGNINQPNSIGVNTLIKDGAMPIVSFDDLCETLNISDNKRLLRIFNKCSEEEKLVLQLIHNEPGISNDLIKFRLSEKTSDVNMLITTLFVKGFIRIDGEHLYLV